MTRLIAMLQARLANHDRGATAVEYGLMAALIAAAIVLIVTALGTQIGTVFTNICTAMGGTACTGGGGS